MRLKFVKILVLLLTLSFLLSYSSNVSADDSLTIPRDVISTSTVKATATHSIRFGLPVAADPIETTDYIMIDFPYFQNPTVPTNITGDYTGTPHVEAFGHRVRITGIYIGPGYGIDIYGIQAVNPIYSDLFDVYIRISPDLDGLVIRNQAHIIASAYDNSITVSAEIQANVGTMRISGTGAPGMFVTFTEGNTVIGTTSAGIDGTFTQFFQGMTPEDHTIMIFGNDADNRVTPATTVEVFTRAYEETDVTGVILPPTLSVDKDKIAPGETITVSGMSTPEYLDMIFTEPPIASFFVYADDTGHYSYTINDTDDWPIGDHKVYAIAEDGLGGQSSLSLTAFFKVVNDLPDPGDNPDCDISRGDLNCDTRIDISDFSILLYYWNTNSAAADISQDGSVNIVDFSIMMFYWGT